MDTELPDLLSAGPLDPAHVVNEAVFRLINACPAAMPTISENALRYDPDPVRRPQPEPPHLHPPPRDLDMTQPEAPIQAQQRPDFPMEQLLLTAEQAAEVLHVGRTTIFALLRDGALRSVRIGRCRRITRAELERYVATLSPDEPASPAPGQPPPTPITTGRRRRGVTHDGQADLFSGSLAAGPASPGLRHTTGAR